MGRCQVWLEMLPEFCATGKLVVGDKGDTTTSTPCKSADAYLHYYWTNALCISSIEVKQVTAAAVQFQITNPHDVVRHVCSISGQTSATVVLTPFGP